MQQKANKPTLDFTRGEAIQDMIARLSDPSDTGQQMRNQMRDGTLTHVVLSNGRTQAISPETFPEIYQWFQAQEIAMGLVRPTPDPKLATMTLKEWGGHKVENPTEPAQKSTNDPKPDPPPTSSKKSR